MWIVQPTLVVIVISLLAGHMIQTVALNFLRLCPLFRTGQHVVTAFIWTVILPKVESHSWFSVSFSLPVYVTSLTVTSFAAVVVTSTAALKWSHLNTAVAPVILSSDVLPVTFNWVGILGTVNRSVAEAADVPITPSANIEMSASPNAFRL
jgi:hypothetical protein